MLIRREILQRIQAGEVSLAFRRWKRATVKSGGSLQTAVGVLGIASVDRVTLRSITEAEASAAGAAGRKSLIEGLSDRDGDVYRIALSYSGEDPRIALRNETQMSKSEMDSIVAKLEKYDVVSKRVPWTLATLEIIAGQPQVSARILSAELDWERLWFKGNVRKLKTMGLTISHSPGYELSPRGTKVLQALRTRK